MKKSLRASLLARAEDVLKEQYKEQFVFLINDLKKDMETLAHPAEIYNLGSHRYGLADLCKIAGKLGMSKADLTAALKPLESEDFRILDLNLLDSESLAITIRTPLDAAHWISMCGIKWGYSARQIAIANKEHPKLRDKDYAERAARADQGMSGMRKTVEFHDPKTGFTITTYTPIVKN